MNHAPKFVTNFLDDIAKLLLRVAVGGLMLFHGVAKVRNGLGGIESMLTEAGLPEWFAYGVYVGEIAAPVLMIAGILTRTSAIVMGFNMVAAMFLAHRDDVLSLGQHGEWALELPALYLVGAACVALMGPGRFALWLPKRKKMDEE